LTFIKSILIDVNTTSAIRATVPPMGQAMSATLWMQSAPAPATVGSAGCGGCVTSAQGPQCRAHVSGEACAHPQLAGRRELIAQVLGELNRTVVDPGAGRGIVDLQWVRGLRIEDGEVELTLSFAPVCGPGKELSESAFQTLRRLLPDTDVYVRHAA
jgi:metal-sulfur cluster biosynthetic enzyme